jgi:hypothetical protein
MKKWSEILRDNSEAILNMMVQAKGETEGTMQGWHIDVEMNEKGEVWTTELFSVGSQSMSSWKGETFIVCSVQSWIAEVNESENIRHYKELFDEYLAQEEAEDGYDTEWEFMQEKHPDILEEWKKDMIEYEIEAYKEEADYILDNIIEEQEQQEIYEDR